MTWNVIVPDRLPPPPDIEQEVFGSRAVVAALGARTENELVGRIEQADAILAWHDLHWTREVLGSLASCKVLVRVGVGFDNVDLRAAQERGIVVCNVPDYGTHDVADHAIALLLSLARGIGPSDREAREGRWAWGLVPTFRLTEKVFGVVGLGRIGAATVLRAKAFGMRVVFYDPYKPSGWDKALGVTRCHTLAELAHASDIVSLHAPLTPETRGMIDAAFFEAARPGLVLINTARGPIIDWAPFTTAFESGRISSAGFDVLPIEPPDPADALLRAWRAGEPHVRDRMIVTPHCAFYSDAAMHEMRRKAAEEALRILSGQAPRNRVG